MKDTFYFTHDYNARTDEKIKRLIRKHGMTGYGIFWAIIEDLYNNANALQTDCDGIAFELRTDSETIKSILHDFDLFIFDGDMFGSLSVQKRLDDRNERSKVASANARKRWENMQTHSDSNATALPLQSEGNAIKERKGKEIKDNTFDLFWDLYDKKVDRKSCERKWSRIDKSEHDKIFQHVERYVKSTPDKKFRKDPETYLNNEAWQNEIISDNKAQKANNEGRITGESEWVRRWHVTYMKEQPDGTKKRDIVGVNEEGLQKIQQSGVEIVYVEELQKPNLKGFVC
jgi:hypothetical protein